MNEIIENNIEAKENSFFYFLHEEGVFDESLFKTYFESVRLLDIQSAGRETIKKVIERNEYIYRSIIYHFLEGDSFVIKNLPQNIGDYIAKIDDENTRLIRML